MKLVICIGIFQVLKFEFLKFRILEILNFHPYNRLILTRNAHCSLTSDNEVPGSNITGPEVIKLFPCSTQLSMKFIMLINVKVPPNVGI